MSMSCLRIKSRSRSSGPSYTLPTETAKGKSLSCLLEDDESFAALPDGADLPMSAGAESRAASAAKANLTSSLIFQQISRCRPEPSEGRMHSTLAHASRSFARWGAHPCRAFCDGEGTLHLTSLSPHTPATFPGPRALRPWSPPQPYSPAPSLPPE